MTRPCYFYLPADGEPLLVVHHVDAGKHLLDGTNEFQVAEFIRSRLSEEKLASPDGAIVAVNANASDPHYERSADRYSAIEKGDWLLIDLLAKGTTPGSVYADNTWVAYVGDFVPARQQEIFNIVIGARDAALSYLEDAPNQGTSVQGWQAYQVARDSIPGCGYGEYFTHRYGHSIWFEVHSGSINLDEFETHDTRHIIPGICFSIQPSIYLPEFGVRSELDVFMSVDGPYASSPVQNEVVMIKD